jgi:hypothetical protein
MRVAWRAAVDTWLPDKLLRCMMRFTAMVLASLLIASRSAPTKPGVRCAMAWAGAGAGAA